MGFFEVIDKVREYSRDYKANLASLRKEIVPENFNDKREEYRKKLSEIHSSKKDIEEFLNSAEDVAVAERNFFKYYSNKVSDSDNGFSDDLIGLALGWRRDTRMKINQILSKRFKVNPELRAEEYRKIAPEYEKIQDPNLELALKTLNFDGTKEEIIQFFRFLDTLAEADLKLKEAKEIIEFKAELVDDYNFSLDDLEDMTRAELLFKIEEAVPKITTPCN